MCGFRVKITYNFSADDTMDTMNILFLGITELKLTKETVLLIKIKGMCFGGEGMNLGSQHYGVIMFIRGENKIDKKRYQIYRYKILIPFIAQTRAEYWEWQVGIPIHEELKAVRCCNGDLSQIDNIMNDTSLNIYK